MEAENMWELAVIALAIVGISSVFLLGYYTSDGEVEDETTGLKPLSFNCEKVGVNKITCNWNNCYSNQTIIALSGGEKHVTDNIRGSHTFGDLESGEYHTVLACGDEVKLSRTIQIE